MYNSPNKNKTGINLTKYVQELYAENYKTSMKGIKDLNKWRGVSCSWIKRVNVKMSTFPKSFYRFNEIPLKNPNRTVCRY